MRRFLLSLLLMAAGFAPATAQAAIALKDTAAIDRAVVKLSDVFTGLPKGIDADIARAPAPGKSVNYNVNTLMYLVRQYGLDWRPNSLADHVVITAAANKISSADIARAVVKALKDQNIAGTIDVDFDRHGLAVELPADRPPDFTLANFQYSPIDRRFRADFTAETDDGPLTLPIAGRITVMREVPVLARRLESGSTIDAGDLARVSLPEDSLNGVVTDASQLVGKELRHDTDEDQPLRDADVMAPRLVTRGGLVTMKIATPLMVITAEGLALQDGTMGEVVRVKNSESKRVIEGIVSGPGLVIVRGPQKLADAQ